MIVLIMDPRTDNGGQGSDLRHHRESSWVLKKPQLVRDQGPEQSVVSGLVHQGLTLEKIRANKFERSERHSASSLVNYTVGCIFPMVHIRPNSTKGAV